jgi:hypothetical protein
METHNKRDKKVARYTTKDGHKMEFFRKLGHAIKAVK